MIREVAGFLEIRPLPKFSKNTFECGKPFAIYELPYGQTLVVRFPIDPGTRLGRYRRRKFLRLFQPVVLRDGGARAAGARRSRRTFSIYRKLAALRYQPIQP